MAAEVDIELEGSNEYPAHYKVMMSKLNEQRQLDQFTDITLIVDGNCAYMMCHLYDVMIKFTFIAFQSSQSSRAPVQGP